MKKVPKSNAHASEGDLKKDLIIPNWQAFLNNAAKRLEEKWYLRCDDIEPKAALSDFVIIRTIGVGNYGRVVLGRKGDDKYYAIKILKKKKILKMKMAAYTLNEKRVLQSINFHFIVNMEYVFKDNCHLYFVMPFVVGGDMFMHLRKVGKLSENVSRFYASQVVLALEYLHFLKIIYRDLKPENLLIDIDGYIKITDLGFAKRISSRTYTMCGTPEYIAPEVMLSKGYGFAVDWWALGILVYELNAGFSPFAKKDQTVQFKNVAEGSYDMRVQFSHHLKDLLAGLLQTNPSKRLGNTGQGAAAVKKASWFHETNWFAIMNKAETAPFTPIVQGPGDTSHYEKFSEEKLEVSSQVHCEEAFAEF